MERITLIICASVVLIVLIVSLLAAYKVSITKKQKVTVDEIFSRLTDIRMDQINTKDKLEKMHDDIIKTRLMRNEEVKK